MFASKVIKMTSLERELVESARDTFESMVTQLNQFKDENPADDDIAYLWDNANTAYCAIDDFLEIYNKQAIGD